MRKRGATSGSGSLWPAVADLSGMEALALSRLWREMAGMKTPADLRGDLLIRDLADLIQSETEGGLSLALRQRLKQLEREADQAKPQGDDAAAGDRGISPIRRLSPGTLLIRVWQGTSHEVVVLEDGFLWRGERLQSLSLIAKRITGTSWNGWRFFGLAERRRGKARPDGSGRPSTPPGDGRPARPVKSPARIVRSATGEAGLAKRADGSDAAIGVGKEPPHG